MYGIPLKLLLEFSIMDYFCLLEIMIGITIIAISIYSFFHQLGAINIPIHGRCSSCATVSTIRSLIAADSLNINHCRRPPVIDLPSSQRLTSGTLIWLEYVPTVTWELDIPLTLLIAWSHCHLSSSLTLHTPPSSLQLVAAMLVELECNHTSQDQPPMHPMLATAILKLMY